MAAADSGVPTWTDRQPDGPADDSGVPSRTAQQPGFPRPTTDEAIERNVVSNAASSDFATVALSESQLDRA